MLAKLFPVLFLVAGTAAGIGAGHFLRPAAQDAETLRTTDDHSTGAGDVADDNAGDKPEYVKISNQFVVPVVQGDRIGALVVLTLSLETSPGLGETIYALEPKLRDAFLRVLFDHANMGGFGGAFTRADRLEPLRTALREAAQQELGQAVRDVLIVDIVRQDA